MGGAGDNGADVIGRLPDGRTLIIQCKRYAPTSTIASRELRELLGAKAHFGADLAVFVTTTRFSRPALPCPVQPQNVQAVPRGDPVRAAHDEGPGRRTGRGPHDPYGMTRTS